MDIQENLNLHFSKNVSDATSECINGYSNVIGGKMMNFLGIPDNSLLK